ncbi:MAG: HEAT repeat domain-containing protein [Candidatus Micrarchaeota archaeon]|nr:HEAT repeat domain-containing protein [Candidatus Micrarchaeota archaeon]
MVPEKGKPKSRQVSLLDAPEDKPDSIDSLVAKAFDSDPHVRLKVAQDLGRIDDPRAVFALIELSTDKEEIVKVAAQHSLGNFKEDAETIVSLEKMLQARKDQKSQPVPAPAASQSQHQPSTQQMAPSIEKLFSHYEPKKREQVKRKLFPSLQKFFGFSKQDWDPLQDVEKITHAVAQEEETEELPPRPQKEHIPAENAPNFPFGQKKEPIPQPRDLVEIEEADAEMVSVTPEEEREIADEEFRRNADCFSHRDNVRAEKKALPSHFDLGRKEGNARAHTKRAGGRHTCLGQDRA